MQTKVPTMSIKFIKSPETCVQDYLFGLARIFPQLKINLPQQTVTLEKDVSNRVGLISGGGSGHEPFTAGFVANGMLTGSCSGSIFASPPASPIYNLIKNVGKTHKGGVVVFIPNYTGDVLNFGLAVERARHEGIQVESIIVDDDCSLLDPKSNRSFARGLGGLVVIYKMAGAMAESGMAFNDIIQKSREIISNLGSMGACISACSLPGKDVLFKLNPGEIEMGVGIHGEAGCSREQFKSLPITIKTIVTKIKENRAIVNGDKVIVVISNLGGMSKLEEYIVAGEAYQQLGLMGIQVLRVFSGHIQTSIEMAGVSITILKIQSQDWLRLLDAATDCVNWPGSILNTPAKTENLITQNISESVIQYPKDVKVLNASAANLLKDCLQAAAQILIVNVEKLNQLDSQVGDGDCGSTLKRLADEILSSSRFTFQNPVNVFKELAYLSSDVMGGTSGAIYSLLFNGMAAKCDTLSNRLNTLKAWSAIFDSGIELILKYSKAREGDRTMLDVLIPCSRVLSESCDSKDLVMVLQMMSVTSNASCDATKSMEAKAGRAAYVNKNMITDVDAGAYAVKIVINELTTLLIKRLQ